MTAIKEFNRYGEELERLLILRTSPLAVKMLEKEADIPEGAIRPLKDRGVHYAQCQAFALSRRQKQTIAMLKEDNWCFAPLIAYGLVDRPEDPNIQQFTNFPAFERGKYIGILSAPLKTASFKPDIIIIYSNTSQLRNMLLSIDLDEREKVTFYYTPPACGYQVVPVISSGQYTVTLPDPGDYQRALAGEDEIILSLPSDKLSSLIGNLKQSEKREFGYARGDKLMLPDFPRPDFYKKLFRSWGLDDK